MRRLLLITLLGLMIVPVLVLAQAEQTQIIDLDDTSVIGEIEDPFIFDVFRQRDSLIEGIQDLNKSFLDEIRVIDKEAFELELKR